MHLRANYVLAAILFAVLAAPASAQTNFPERPVHIIVPTAPGGAIDTTARVVGAKLSSYWGQPVLIDNKPGASMIIGAELVAKAPADGYTLLVAHDGTMAMNYVVYPKLTYDPQRDFLPVSLVSTIPLVLFVNNSVPANSAQDLIRLAKEKPGKLNHAAGGTATLLAAELFKNMAGVDVTEVQYKGGAPAVASTVAGETQLCFADLATANAGLHSGNVRALAVTSLKRSSHRPDLPTLDESGVRGFDDSTWMGIFAPVGTPAAVGKKIEGDVERALKEPDVRQRFDTLAMEIQGGTAEELKTILANDIAKWSRLVKATGFKLDMP